MRTGSTRPTKRLTVGITAFALSVLATVTAIAPAQASDTADRIDHPSAEIFATNNTAMITDPNDPRLRTRLIRFDLEVRAIIAANGARPTTSTLLNGVFWSDSTQQAIYERSREFDVEHVSAAGLRHLGEILAKQFHQESVLTFQFLPAPPPTRYG